MKLSNQECWLLELTHIPAEHRATEAKIQTERWFDYRPMTAAEATYEFAECFRRQYLESYKQTKDIRTVGKINPFAPADIFKSPDIIPMWLARQAADSIGVKYEFYLHYVFNEFTRRGWKNLPRPNQIYGEEVVMSIDISWKQRCKDILQLAENNFFTTQYYVGHPDQTAYYEHLGRSIRGRQHSHYAVNTLLTKKIIPAEVVVAMFGTEVYQRALMS